MHMKKVLIVSDDAHTRAWVSSAIEPMDVVITNCVTGETTSKLSNMDYALVVIDAGRDPEPFVQLVESATASGADVSTVLLIESDALSSLRLPAQMGADFVVRGASSAEMAARVRTLLWPGEEVGEQELLRIDDLTVNLATYQANLRGRPIDFTYLEYALFAFLVTHPNRAYSREMLLRRVWGSDYYGGSRTVDVHIRRIRSKVGSELMNRLETVRNVGYLWNGS
ncbi:MAG: response regulator transcription factor [Actinomycetota bacterium]|jgi:DNA-binding response OmpR family regulator|nr:response regulator transcription factor [Actinomycetota bacterium]